MKEEYTTYEYTILQLTQEPYMVSGMHTGDVGTYPYGDITDWIVFTEEDRISPDEVYLMEM